MSEGGEEVLELLQGQGEPLRRRSSLRLAQGEHVSDHEGMLSLLTVMAVVAAVGALALRYGADSRRDERNL
jgi:hypothetical protein